MDSYRPISLTSVLCKVFERIIKNRLNWYLESNNLITIKQCGFRPGRSTVDQLLYLQNSIINAFATKRHLLAIFFDCSKAFDTAWRFKILQTMHDFNFRGHLPKFIRGFLTNWTFSVRLGNKLSDTHELQNGVPQGSVLSPTLFNLAINDIVNEVQPPVKCALFADDFTIFLSCSDLIKGQQTLQNTVDRLQNWSALNGIKFSSTKTTAVHFCKIRNCPNNLNITLKDSCIPTADSVRYLGLYFDNKLTWSTHVDALKKSCSQRLNLMKKLSHTFYGANRSSLLKIYRSLTRSK